MDHQEVLRAYQAQKENTPPKEGALVKLRRKIPKPKLRSIHRHPKRLIKYGIVAFILVMILIPIITYLYFARDIYDRQRLMNRGNVGVTLLDRNNKPFFAFYQPKNKTIISLSDIPDSVQKAVVSVEDKDFYNHSGFSVRGIGRAIFTDVSNENLSQGGSTITQQLVKNLLLNSERSPLRKYQEIVLAIEIDRVYSKDDILEMYLNSVYFGEGTFGIEDASEVYFNKSAKNLNLAESALLAGLLQAPSATSPLSNDPSLAKKRQELILDQMFKQGYITQGQEVQAISQRLVYAQKKPEDINLNAPHFALMVRDWLAQKYGGEDNLAKSGMTVKTTLNLDWQKYAETVVYNQVNNLQRNKVNNGAAVVIDPKTGQVLVLVGSKDWADETVGKFNIALAERQPGSAMKPIVYGAALEKNLITPATLLDDKPTDFGGGYKPKDFDGKYRGQVTVRRALSNSLNIPAVEVIQKLGVNNAVSKAKQMGLSTLGDADQYGFSFVLGAAEVRLIDLTAAYGAFATYGNLHDTNFVLSVNDKNGQPIYGYDDQTKQVISPDAAFLISSILSDDGARAEEFGGSLTTSHHAAVKTGTTDNFRDAWTVGYTPSLVVGAWVGNNDNTPMDNIAGSLGAAPIFRQMMDKFLVGKPVENFKPTGNIIEEDICLDSSSRIHEYFIRGTAPSSCPNQSPATTAPSATNPPTPAPTLSVSPTDTPRSQTPQPTPTPHPTATPTPTPTPSPPPSNLPIASPGF